MALLSTTTLAKKKEKIRSKILPALLTFKGRFLKGECWPMKRQDTVIDKVLHQPLSGRREFGVLETGFIPAPLKLIEAQLSNELL